jgi:hypothetical protein
MTASQFYDAVAIKTLQEQFELQKVFDPVLNIMVDSDEVEECLKIMLRGRSPVVNVPVKFEGQIDGDYVSFAHVEKQTPLQLFGKTLIQKRESLEDSMKELTPEQDYI